MLRLFTVVIIKIIIKTAKTIEDLEKRKTL